jgi:hypothetical protein
MYYVIEISKTKDKETESKAIYSYPTHDEAIATFHTKMGSAMKNENYLMELCQVIDDRGAVQDTEYWERQVEPETVEDTENE